MFANVYVLSSVGRVGCVYRRSARGVLSKGQRSNAVAGKFSLSEVHGDRGALRWWHASPGALRFAVGGAVLDSTATLHRLPQANGKIVPLDSWLDAGNTSKYDKEGAAAICGRPAALRTQFQISLTYPGL